MTPITIPIAQFALALIGLGLTIGGVIAMAVRRSARTQALYVARAEVDRHASGESHTSVTGELRYIREQVDWIKRYLLNGKGVSS